MNKNKWILLILIIAVILGAGYGIWSNVKNQKNVQQKVYVNVYGLKGPTSIGMIKMFEDRPVINKNFEFNYQVADSPDILVSKLLSQEADIAALPTNVAAKVYNKGIDYKLTAVTSWGVLYLLSTDSSITDWESLKNRTMNLTDKGSTPDIIFRYLLSENGLNPDKDIKLDYTLGHIEAAQAMIAGRINTVVLPEPFVTMVTTQNKNAKIVLDLQDEWKKVHGENIPFAQTCLVIKGDLINGYPNVVSNFLNQYKESIEWVNSNKQNAGVLVEKHNIGMKAKVAETAIPRCNLRFEDATLAKPAVEKFLKLIFDFSPKDIGGKMPDENFYYKK